MCRDRTRLISKGNELYEIDLNCLERRMQREETKSGLKQDDCEGRQRKNGSKENES